MPTAAEQFMPELIRTLRSYAPTVTADTDAQGRESSILTIRNPRDSRWSLQFICPNQPDRQGELYGSLWFGAGVHQRFTQNIQKQFHKYRSQKPQRVSSF